MTPAPALSRRSLLLGAAAATTVAALPWSDVADAAVADAAKRVFGFGVASGDPVATAVVLWTRVTPTPAALPGSGKGGPVTVRWQVAADEGFRQIVKQGSTTTSAARDHTVHVDVTGLAPYTRYFYRFLALGQTSPVGRTQTAPDIAGETHALRFGVVSCSNYTGGFFSPYRHLAARDDLDAVLCLGDYLYEYGNTTDRYGPDELAGKREHEPATEMVSLADYRKRHALYKTDPDLAAAHRRHPWILTFDDHEVCDNTWANGGNNHQEGEGSFATRKKLAYQAYLEWVPIRLPDQRGAAGTRFWRRFTYGDLAELSVLETRQNRSEQVPLGDETALSDPTRHLPEPAQMTWLTSGVKANPRPWNLLANQVVLAQVRIPSTPTVLGMAAAMLPALSSPVPAGGYVFNTDQWDGYVADQTTLLTALDTAKADTVVLTGDIHSSWANDLPLDPGSYVPGVTPSAGTEFVCPSISSDGFYEIAMRQRAGATALSSAFQVANRHIRFLEGIHHGFLVVDVTPERVAVDFVWIDSATSPDDPRLDPLAVAAVGASWQTLRGSRAVSQGTPLGARADQPRTAVVRRSAAPAPAPATPSLPVTGGGAALPALGLAAAAAALLARRGTSLH